jgi:hypothetical protein
MWCLKFHGETYYVNHVDAKLSWSTKETSDNTHTKGSLKFKNALITINAENEATITELSLFDKIRLRNQKLGITRIMFSPYVEIHKALQKNEVRHSPFKTISGACASTFVICDILDEMEMTFIALKYANQFRILMPNESYYQEYDMVKGKNIAVDYSDEDTPYEYS